MASFETAASVLNDVAIECGLGPVADGMTSPEPNMVQLRTVLKRVGRGLVKEHAFLQFRLEHTFTTTSATVYAYPTGFLSMVNDAGWNRTSQYQLEPLGSSGWQKFKAIFSPQPFELHFRPTGAGIELHAAPTSGQTVTYEYRSRFWVQPTGQTSPTLDAPTAGTDTLCIDSHLLTRALRYAFLASKGFDVSEALPDFQAALATEMSVNGVAAPVLSLTRPMAPGPTVGTVIGGASSSSGSSGFGVLY